MPNFGCFASFPVTFSHAPMPIFLRIFKTSTTELRSATRTPEPYRLFRCRTDSVKSGRRNNDRCTVCQLFVLRGARFPAPPTSCPRRLHHPASSTPAQQERPHVATYTYLSTVSRRRTNQRQTVRHTVVSVGAPRETSG